MIKKQSIFIIIAAFSSFSVNAAISIYPTKSLLGLTEDCLSDGPNIEKEKQLPQINCDFKLAMQNGDMKTQAVNKFINILNTNLSQVMVKKIDNSNKNRTFIASLEVLRADKFFVNKGSTTEIFLPLTLSAKFTNVLTGEVIYSESFTLNQPIQVLTDSLETSHTKSQINTAYNTSLLKLSEQIATEVVKKFNYNHIDSNVIAYWNNYIVLDKGYGQGIGKFDELTSDNGSLIKVVYAESNYSVGLPILIQGKPNVYSKIVSSNTQAINKPKVVIVDIVSSENQSTDLIQQLFVDNLSPDAAFSVIPINLRYSKLVDLVSQETLLTKSEDLSNRKLPGYSIRIAVLPSIYISQTTGNLTKREFVSISVFAELIDSSGRVIYSEIESENIEDIVTENMGIPMKARKDIAMKNAIIKLAENFSNNIKFTKADFLIKNKPFDNVVRIEDPNSTLPNGMSVEILKPVKLNGTNILIPTYNATVSRSGNSAELNIGLPIDNLINSPIEVDKNDFIIFDKMNTTSFSNNSQSFCENLNYENLGDIDFPNFSYVVYNQFAKNQNVSFFASGKSAYNFKDLQTSIDNVSNSANFGSRKIIKPLGNCIQPAYRILKKLPINCNSPKSCDIDLAVGIALRFYNQSGQKIDVKGIEQNIQLKKVDPEIIDQSVQLELIQRVPSLIVNLIKQIDNKSP